MTGDASPTRDDLGRSRLLLVENEPLVAKALRGAARAAGFDIVEASSAGEARAALSRVTVDAVIVEAILPDGSGLDLLQEIREGHRPLAALVLSGALCPEVANRAHLLRASCVFKPDIVSNVRVFLERAKASTGEASRRTLAAAREVSITFDLTAREREIVELAVLGVPRERLASELGVTENTLKTLIRRLLAKCRETRVEGVARAVLDEVLYLACATEPIWRGPSVNAGQSSILRGPDFTPVPLGECEADGRTGDAKAA